MGQRTQMSWLQRTAGKWGERLLSYSNPLRARTPGPTQPGGLSPQLKSTNVSASSSASQKALGDSVYSSSSLMELLFHRMAINPGPVQTRFSTFGGQLTPESIANAINLANMGEPFQFADLCEMVIEKDAHLGGVIEQRISGIIGKPDRIEPPEHFQGDEVAVSVANWMTAAKAKSNTGMMHDLGSFLPMV